MFGKKSVGQIENEKVGEGEQKDRVEGGGEALAAEKALEVWSCSGLKLQDLKKKESLAYSMLFLLR